MKFTTTVKGSSGARAAQSRLVERGDYAEIEISVQGKGALHDLTVHLSGFPEIEEIFLAAPNFHGIEVAHPTNILYQGLYADHRNCLFGRQWFFSPSPMVHPVRTSNGWMGVGLGAPQGCNHYSGWSYRPKILQRFRHQDSTATSHAFDLEIHYDGQWDGSGHVASILISKEAFKTPQEVIKWYTELLYEKGWAVRPDREPAQWWKRPLVCIWGEQCNLNHAKGNHFPNGDPVSMYETQDNQMRAHELLDQKGIPVGVVSMSDKWQLKRQRLLPDPMKYPDLRGFADHFHAQNKKVITWLGLWHHDDAPADWCLCSENGDRLTLNPRSEGYAAQLKSDVEHLISPEGYDLDGFFLDFTSEGPFHDGVKKSSPSWGLELLRDYIKLIHDAAKSVKPDAMIMTHCCHPLFADITDVLRLNDFCYKQPDVAEQGRYRQQIAKASSDWLINTDNWFMYSIEEWRRYQEVQPELGIPASWYAYGVHGDGTLEYQAFTDADYARWKQIWDGYVNEIVEAG